MASWSLATSVAEKSVAVEDTIGVVLTGLDDHV